MALTSDSDLYGAVLDRGINTVVRQMMRQRPSLFNYGTSAVRRDPTLLCRKIDAAPGVTELITVLPAIPLLPMGSIDLGEIGGSDVTLSGGNLVLDFAAQLTDLQVDFHPGDIVTLPAELSPPLQPQHLAFRAKVCAGLSCIPREILKKLPIPRGATGRMLRAVGKEPLRSHGDRTGALYSQAGSPASLAYSSIPAASSSLSRARPRVPTEIYIPPNRLDCFCVELFGTAHGQFTGPEGDQRMLLSVDGVELQDIAPQGLENGIECYMVALLDRVILPQLSDVIAELAFRVQEIPAISGGPGSSGSVRIGASTAVAHNPAIEDDQLKLFLNLEEFSLVIPPVTIGGGGGGGTPPPTRIEKSRVQTGPASITGAVSEAAFRKVFGAIRDTGHFEIHIAPQTANLLGITGSVSAHIRFHLANGDVTFEADNTIRISELDVKWDQLDLTLGFDLPKLCFQLCYPLLWPPWYDCVELGCLFEANPDFSFTIPLPTGFTSEISVNAGLKTYYSLGSPNEWQVYITPSRVDLDIVDVADTVGDVLDAALNAAISALGLPGWVSDITSNVVDLVRDLLDIPDDLGEWLQDLIFDTLGVETTIESYIAQFFADSLPILRLEDPLVALEADGALIPVKIPIEYLEASVNDDEMIVVADVGGSI